MNERRVVVVGAGGLGREVISLAHDCPEIDPIGVLDDARPDDETLDRMGVPYLGTLDDAPTGLGCLVGIGSPHVRVAVSRQAAAAGLELVVAIHPSASVGRDVRIGAGSIVMPGAVITASVDIGSSAVVNAGVLVAHDSRIGDGVTVNPGTVIADDVVIGDRSFIGSSCFVPRGSRVPDDTALEPGSRFRAPVAR